MANDTEAPVRTGTGFWQQWLYLSAVVIGVLVLVGALAYAQLTGPNALLRDAAYRGDVEAIRALLRAGANPRSRSWNGTDAFQAAGEGYAKRHHLRGLTGVHPELERIERVLGTSKDGPRPTD